VISLDKTADCFGKGLLKRVARQPDLALKDIRQATFFLEEASDLIELEKNVMAALALYNAYFHCARALLFYDGIKERSHYCVARYIEQEYVQKKLIDVRFLNAFDVAMNIRHTAQYSTETVEIEEDLSELHATCVAFVEEVGGLIDGSQQKQ
jgi:uncharacterized protein (UPF0332 family)